MNTTKSEIKLTKQIWKLTKSGKLKWKLNEIDHYIAKYKGLKIQIEFFNFARINEESSDDSCGTVFIRISDSDLTNGIGFDFSVGTEQYTNLRKAVYFNKKEWKARKKRIRNSYKNTLKYLEKI